MPSLLQQEREALGTGVRASWKNIISTTTLQDRE